MPNLKKSYLKIMTAALNKKTELTNTSLIESNLNENQIKKNNLNYFLKNNWFKGSRDRGFH